MGEERAILSDVAIKSLKIPTNGSLRVSDGFVPGLYLEVFPTGKKVWKLRYAQQPGKETRMSLGAYPDDLTIKAAREKAAKIRHGLANGQYPVTKASAGPALAETFGAVAEDWARQFLVEPLKAARTVKRDRLTLDRHILPVLGQVPIKEVDAVAALGLLRPIAERENYETASRVKTICSQVFRYAMSLGLVSADPFPGLKGAFPSPVKNHYAAITDPADVGRLMRDIWAYSGNVVVGLGLQMLCYVFTRPTELRLAEWKEIQWEDRLWAIQAARMKMRQDHLVPLSTQVINLLTVLKNYTGKSQYLLTCKPDGSQPISDMTFNRALKAMGYTADQVTPHGLRSMASTLLNQQGFRSDWIERELAHEDVNKIRAIYNRAAYLEQRRTMMQAWADYLDDLRESAE